MEIGGSGIIEVISCYILEGLKNITINFSRDSLSFPQDYKQAPLNDSRAFDLSEYFRSVYLGTRFPSA
jgi:hypothetical protein